MYNLYTDDLSCNLSLSVVYDNAL
uniref:Uncharacterized protein n=1 Tax=Ciona intestinalis TaxID=7719 RepID=H2XMF9_CIOIN